MIHRPTFGLLSGRALFLLNRDAAPKGPSRQNGHPSHRCLPIWNTITSCTRQFVDTAGQDGIHTQRRLRACKISQYIIILCKTRCNYLPEAGSVAPPSSFWPMLTVQWFNIIR